MSGFLVDEGALDRLSWALERIADDLGDALIAHAVASDGNLPVVRRSHSALVDRWQLGLSTAQGALHETSASVTACATAYRLTDDDQSVEFQGAIA